VAEGVARAGATAGTHVIKTIVAIAFIGLNYYTYHHLANKAVYPERLDFSEFPLELSAWHCPKADEMDAKTERNLGVSDYFLCRYINQDLHAVADIYIGYHRSQVREEGGGSGENSIHPPAHCLPGSGWDIIDNQTVPLDLEGLPQSGRFVKRMIIAKGQNRQLVYYWYQSRGRVIAHDWQKIFYVGLDRAIKQRTDGSLVRFTIPIIRNDEEKADLAFHDLAPRILAEIPEYVPN
jgi:EpsI family protein